MSASTENGFDKAWSASAPSPARWDELPTDGSHAWLGLLLVLGSGIVVIRGLCWLAAALIRALH